MENIDNSLDVNQSGPNDATDHENHESVETPTLNETKSEGVSPVKTEESNGGLNDSFSHDHDYAFPSQPEVDSVNVLNSSKTITSDCAISSDDHESERNCKSAEKECGVESSSGCATSHADSANNVDSNPTTENNDDSSQKIDENMGTEISAEYGEPVVNSLTVENVSKLSQGDSMDESSNDSKTVSYSDHDVLCNGDVANTHDSNATNSVQENEGDICNGQIEKTATSKKKRGRPRKTNNKGKTKNSESEENCKTEDKDEKCDGVSKRRKSRKSRGSVEYVEINSGEEEGGVLFELICHCTFTFMWLQDARKSILLKFQCYSLLLIQIRKIVQIPTNDLKVPSLNFMYADLQKY